MNKWQARDDEGSFCVTKVEVGESSQYFKGEYNMLRFVSGGNDSNNHNSELNSDSIYLLVSNHETTKKVIEGQ